MNFFQRHRDKPAGEIEPPGDPPALPKDEKEETRNTVEPIHVNDAEYEMLTRALHPESATVLPDLKMDLPESPELKAPAIADKAVEPPQASPRPISSDWPPGTPIV